MISCEGDLLQADYKHGINLMYRLAEVHYQPPLRLLLGLVIVTFFPNLIVPVEKLLNEGEKISGKLHFGKKLRKLLWRFCPFRLTVFGFLSIQKKGIRIFFRIYYVFMLNIFLHWHLLEKMEMSWIIKNKRATFLWQGQKENYPWMKVSLMVGKRRILKWCLA